MSGGRDRHGRDEADPTGSDAYALWLDQLLDKCRPSIRAHTHRIADQPADADDLANEAETRIREIARRSKDLRSHPDPEGYIHRTVENASMDLGRHRLRERPVPDPDAPAGNVASAEQHVVQDEDRHLLARAFGRLPIDDRRVLVDRHVEGNPYREVARTLGMTPSGARSAARRARTSLRIEVAELIAGRWSDRACREIARRIATGTKLGVEDRAHLESCRTCTETEASLRGLLSRFRAWAIVTAPALSTSDATIPRPGPERSTARYRVLGGAAAAVAAAGIVIASYMPSNVSDSTPRPGTAAEIEEPARPPDTPPDADADEPGPDDDGETSEPGTGDDVSRSDAVDAPDPPTSTTPTAPSPSTATEPAPSQPAPDDDDSGTDGTWIGASATVSANSEPIADGPVEVVWIPAPPDLPPLADAEATADIGEPDLEIAITVGNDTVEIGIGGRG